MYKNVISSLKSDRYFGKCRLLYIGVNYCLQILEETDEQEIPFCLHTQPAHSI
jgi:hypothetical protein